MSPALVLGSDSSPRAGTSALWAVLCCLSLLLAGEATAQQRATVETRQQRITTYPFSDPNPVPALALGDDLFRFYPYFTFDGFAHEAEAQDWKVVELENSYIQVSVLPEVGGKIWGAIEKSTGEEFLYKNDVLKFRSIGIRGPWTSGGVEHNFGLDLGHTPATATPVDYRVQETDEGVSVVVGGLDLPSRTRWRVSIEVPDDKAYVETNSAWYNPTPLHHSYLSWENAAVEARDDLQFFFPGQYYVGHGGDAHPWPIDEEGRDLSYYRNNDFGGHKSYHVMGTYADYYAGYWHDADFGFGHWAPYPDAPGKKIWIWSLARSGAIWEDLLTDTDGQYVEPQSGVKFNQAGLHSGEGSPFNQLMLAPYRTDRKEEVWFPIKATGGVVDASPYGTLNATREGDTLRLAINALQALRDTLAVTVNGAVVHREPLALRPMEVHETQVALPPAREEVRAAVGRHKLVYTSRPETENLERPVRSPEGVGAGSAEQLFRRAEDQLSMRRHSEALATYRAVLEQEPTHSRALTRIAEIHYRQGQYEEGLGYVRRVLEQNAYHPGANFVYGLLQRRLGHRADAKDGLSWASRSLEYRAGAYAQLAFIALQEQRFEQAADYARRALDYNRNSLVAHEALSMAYRHLGQKEAAQEAAQQLLELDPLSHFARFEQYLLAPTPETRDAFQAMIRNELPHETYLELAMSYVQAGFAGEAIRVLEAAPAYPTVSYWLAYLKRESAPAESRAHLVEAVEQSPRFVFPFRLETLPVLEWARAEAPSWKTTYYLGLLHWSNRRTQKARALFAQCGEEPPFAPFYVARSVLFEEDRPEQALRDAERAVHIAPEAWRPRHALIARYNEAGQYDRALRRAEAARDRFPDHYIVGMDYARSLLNNREYEQALAVLEGLRVLPYEGAREGHDLYAQAHTLLALSRMEAGRYEQAVEQLEAAKAWPEHLGAGKPYAPDTRLPDYLLARAHQRLGESEQAASCFEAVAAHAQANEAGSAFRYLEVLALRALGKGEEARQQLAAWQNAADADETLVQWATARFEGEVRRARALAQTLREERSEGGRRWADDAVMVYQVLQATGD